MTNLLHWFCLVSLILCSIPALPAGADELKAELVNIVMEDWGGMGYPTGQVQLTFPDGRTLLLPYRSHLQPVVAGGKVHIFVTEDAEVKSIVIYDPAKGQGQSFYPLPDDLDPYYGSPSFSPDGTRVAYYCPLGARQESGFIDRTGKIVIPLQSQWFARGKFSEGLASVAVKWKYGFIDTTGKMVIPPQFDSASDFSEGLAAVRVGERGGFGVRVRSWPDWQLLWESPSYKELDITHPFDPPVWKTNSLVEVDLPFRRPQGPLTFQVPEPGGKDAN